MSTVRAYGTLAGEFIAFAGTRGGMARCDAGTLEAFVATLAGYQVKTVEQKLCALRSFLRFASAAGLVDAAVLAIPAARSARRPGSRRCGIRRGGQDRRGDQPGQSVRKRDSAIILLITRLGCAAWTSGGLEFADFDWRGRPGCW